MLRQLALAGIAPPFTAVVLLALIAPVPDVPRLAPVPTTIAAVVLVPLPSALNAPAPMVAHPIAWVVVLY